MTQTTSATFRSCTEKQEDLLSVRPGIPSGEALDEASCMLEMAIGVVNERAQDDATSVLYAARYLIQTARAIVESVREGLPT